MIAEHNNKKTKHYQIMLANYDFKNHANIRYKDKAATSKAGKELQDMGAVAFEGQALR
ncbi:hypothetical protein [Campylobacter majalis]|uniref:hypothetical protein n=1 Tax=Campylobacter majalis TaxID=2790656 RepID=UPI003D69CEC5